MGANGIKIASVTPWEWCACRQTTWKNYTEEPVTLWDMNFHGKRALSFISKPDGAFPESYAALHLVSGTYRDFDAGLDVSLEALAFVGVHQCLGVIFSNRYSGAFYCCAVIFDMADKPTKHHLHRLSEYLVFEEIVHQLEPLVVAKKTKQVYISIARMKGFGLPWWYGQNRMSLARSAEILDSKEAVFYIESDEYSDEDSRPSSPDSFPGVKPLPSLYISSAANSLPDVGTSSSTPAARGRSRYYDDVDITDAFTHQLAGIEKATGINLFL
ncbi:hypothetical protein B0T26DRAFT_869758 [Lasiosphaeria miniovina]|uniref:Uncharacterized protein n=1 Tax=Lasiosphaeria miniovina TaxID=1954250 RepID=A0AA40B6V9_9PEZI|nr:uncharacterized protein B0T26DRAFT_869758 [Lasiosphaeria miniovina]KAK0728785.1 hypothetical protein B0T26DRAFT_869758 [Lasiosphaeria miniovina]